MSISDDARGNAIHVIGAMSGTSADGVDAALVRLKGRWPRPHAMLVDHCAQEYPAELKRRIFSMRGQGVVALDELAALARDIALQYTQAVQRLMQLTHITPNGVAAIAAHGQTLYHQPPLTLQWLDPAVLARATDVAVISDFRRADCAVGGQGAPLVPFADWICFGHEDIDRILLNLGGIANITHLPAGGGIDTIAAFDTGPANCISDWLCRTFEPDGLGFDVNGRRAAEGRIIPSVSEVFLADDYFTRKAPKSTDGPEMIRSFIHAVRGVDSRFDPSSTAGLASLRLEDLLATAAHVSVRSIVEATAHLRSRHWIAAGGGVQNKTMMNHLQSMLPPGTILQLTDDLGIPWQAREAMAFAILGAATLAGRPANVPSVTGAAHAAILGTITPRPLGNPHNHP